MSRRAGEVAALALLAALATALLWPLPAALLDGRAVGHPLGDLADHYQGTWWFGGELLAGRWPDHTTLTHWPERRPFWHVDPVGALLALPLRPLGFPAAWNLLLLLQAGGAALAGWAAARDLSGDALAAVPAGLLVGAGAVSLGFLHSGLSELVGLAPVVGATWAALRATGRDPRGRPAPPWAAPLSGALLGLCATESPYLVVSAGIAVAGTVPGAGWRGRVAPAGTALALGALLSAPYALYLRRFVEAPGAVASAATAPGWRPASLPGTDLLGFLWPGPYTHPDTPALGNPGILHVHHLGWVALGLAALGLARAPGARRLAAPAAVAAVAALGPVLTVAHRPVRLGGLPVLLPEALLQLAGGPFSFLHHPYRLVVGLLPLLGLLAALGARRLPPWGRALAAVALAAEVALASPAPWPLATTEVRAPAIYARLPPGPVLDWPPDATSWNRRYLLWQVEHGRPVPYGVNEFLPARLRRDPLVAALLDALDDPRARARNRDVPHPGPVRLEPGPPALDGLAAIVLHREALSRGERRRAERILRARLGPPAVDEGSEAAWVLGGAGTAREPPLPARQGR